MTSIPNVKNEDLHNLTIKSKAIGKLLLAIERILKSANQTLDSFRQTLLTNIFEQILIHNNNIISELLNNNRVSWSLFNDIFEVAKEKHSLNINSKRQCVYYGLLQKIVRSYSSNHYNLLTKYATESLSYKIRNIDNIMTILCSIYENYYICIDSLNINCLLLLDSCDCAYKECKCIERNSTVTYYIDSEDMNCYLLDEYIQLILDSLKTEVTNQLSIIVDFRFVDSDKLILKYLDMCINTVQPFVSQVHEIVIKNLPSNTHLTPAYISSVIDKGIIIIS